MRTLPTPTTDSALLRDPRRTGWLPAAGYFAPGDSFLTTGPARTRTGGSPDVWRRAIGGPAAHASAQDSSDGLTALIHARRSPARPPSRVLLLDVWSALRTRLLLDGSGSLRLSRAEQPREAARPTLRGLRRPARDAIIWCRSSAARERGLGRRRRERFEPGAVDRLIVPPKRIFLSILDSECPLGCVWGSRANRRKGFSI